jgi:uncharacterized protein (TIGR02145 family)
MKRSLAFLALLFSLMGGLRSQSIIITFEGTVSEVPAALDSILVMNQTAGGDTTIYFPDQVLVLGTVGISEAGTPGPSMQALPNPFAGSTEVVMHSTGSEALITLHDVAGRTLVARSANLPAGFQRIRVSSEGPGVHLLTVVQGGVRSTLRLTATEGDGVASLSIFGGADRGVSKSDRSVFTWAPGDALRYIGYATNGDIVHSGAIDEVPEATATRTFVMAAGAVCPGSPTVTDIDGNVYPAVQIGGQCWMAENLNTTRYNDGSTIPNVTDPLSWIPLTSGAWCSYDNDGTNDDDHGKLYNWYAALNLNICPQGWHVPADSEWTALSDHLGGPSVAGGKMKAISGLWVTPNIDATNESGFSALPAGGRGGFHGEFGLRGTGGFWWSTSAGVAMYAGLYGLGNFGGAFGRSSVPGGSGFCLRCIKD